MSDCVSTGKVIRMLTLVDDCTRECPAIEVDTSLGGLQVRRVLDRVAAERGLPEAIVLDNGPGFCGRALAAWSEERAVRLEFIQPGQPVQNAYAESFNGRLCDECLNANWVHQPQRRKAKNRNLAARLQLPTPTQFVGLLAARRICTDMSGDEGMRKANTEMLVKRRPLLQTSSPLKPKTGNSHWDWYSEWGHITFTHSQSRSCLAINAFAFPFGWSSAGATHSVLSAP